MTEQVRVLGPGDEPALLAFLEKHASTTMFFRANLRKAGIVDQGEMFQGTYVGVWREGSVVGAAVHNWNGDVHVQCPVGRAEAVLTAVKETGRDVRGFLGPWEQIVDARQVLGLEDRPVRTQSRERLFELKLEDLRTPGLLSRNDASFRVATEHDIESPLTDWRLEYEVENLGGTASEARRARGREMIEGALREDALFVLEHEGALVSMSAFNASLPDCVQIGGVFTPPSLRSRGYARSVVAGSLLYARAKGVRRSILFTEEANAPAQAAYRALGYEPTGEYGLILYEKP